MLRVEHVYLRLHHKHFRLINNPFPAPLHPASCLGLVVQYHAVQRTGKPCELVIESDDPDHPVRCVDVIAWADWDCCEEHECACRKEKRDCCCRCERHEKCRDDDRCDDDDDEHKEDEVERHRPR